MGQIGRIYNTANKTRSFAVVLMMRQLGVVTGPLCILFMEKLAFKWKITENYTLEVTKFSAVGLFLGLFKNKTLKNYTSKLSLRLERGMASRFYFIRRPTASA